ncbi:molybdenum cofactor sulfurase [Williamsia sp. D3]|nr:molybdenum cofactor sulfurase [Williamsia sp. D3]
MSLAVGTVLAVCAVHEEHRLAGGVGISAIDKRAIDGPVDVNENGLDIDHVCDVKHHGGLDQAVYAYSEDEAQRWATELDRELPYGWFGENLRIAGVATTDAVIGERWKVGDTLELEVTIARTPCRTFADWAQEENWIKRFNAQADVGCYLRVVQPGAVTAGDVVRVISRPDHGVLVRHLITGPDRDALVELLAADSLPPKVVRDAERWLRKKSR